jgi:hypothetical protein
MGMQELRMRYVSGYRDLGETFFRFGFSGILQELRNRKSLWSIKDKSDALLESGTFGSSISDVPEYLSVCKLAAENDEVFSKFKRCYEYRLVLEHVTRRQGDKYLEYVRNDSELLNLLIKTARTEVGQPFRYDYPIIGKVSPTQIRYAKIVRDLRVLFPNLKNAGIAEIGVGNGGLAAQVSAFFEVDNYNLIDLPEVLSLTSKVLKLSSPGSNFKFIPPKNVAPHLSDLLISNYAFSELNKEFQDFYFDNFVACAKAGYMIYNHIHSDPSISYSANDMMKRIPGAEILNEDPFTYRGNVVLVWGHDANSKSKFLRSD